MAGSKNENRSDQKNSHINAGMLSVEDQDKLAQKEGKTETINSTERETIINMSNMLGWGK